MEYSVMIHIDMGQWIFYSNKIHAHKAFYN